MIVEKDSKKILGAHVMGTGADEIINIFAFATKIGISTDQLKSVIFAYPTAASDIEYLI